MISSLAQPPLVIMQTVLSNCRELRTITRESKFENETLPVPIALPV